MAIAGERERRFGPRLTTRLKLRQEDVLADSFDMTEVVSYVGTQVGSSSGPIDHDLHVPPPLPCHVVDLRPGFECT